MTALDKISQWINTTPIWQQVAARHLLSAGEISTSQREQIVKLLKASCGGPKDDARQIELTDSVFAEPTVPQTKGPTVLKALRDLKHANALAEQQELVFSEEGVTAIYGGNASGKSGYVRVLKRACRARGAASKVLPNVFNEEEDSPASAEIIVRASGQDHAIDWEDIEVPQSVLSSIAVFDMDAARFYVDEDHDVVFLPYGMDVFEKLGALCDTIREVLKFEIVVPKEIPEELLKVDRSDPVGALIHNLSGHTKTEEIDELALLRDDEIGRIEQLNKIIVQLSASDPEKLAAAKRRTKNRISAAKDAAEILGAYTSLEYFEKLKNSHNEAIKMSAASQIASAKQFDNEPLAGVGTDVWRELYSAARHFSVEVAYPKHDFPNVDTDSRCVLCLQELDDKAKNRFLVFDEFMKADLESKAQEAIRLRDQLWGRFESQAVFPDVITTEVLDEIGEIEVSTKNALKSFLMDAAAMASVIKEAKENDNWNIEISPVSPPSDALDYLATQLEAEAVQLEANSAPDKRLALEKERNALVARQSLAKFKKIIKQNVAALANNKLLNDCITETNPGSISRAGREIMSVVVSDELRKKVSQYLHRFGADHIELELAHKVRAGAIYHYIRFKTPHSRAVEVSEVLSEGEQHIVALAAFLAEVSTITPSHGIVLDDPTSSLDHEWRHQVAEVMVSESKARQIIIFTHDVVFLMALYDEAVTQRAHWLQHYIYSGALGTGIVGDTIAPWNGMNVHQRIEAIQNSIMDAQNLYQDGETDKYRNHANECYNKLRKAWEAAVEEQLFNKTVRRFSNEVQTKRLEGVVVKNEDLLTVDEGMSKCSNAVHDLAPELNKPAPEPDEIQEDLNNLRSFLDNIKQRRRDAKNSLAIFEQPLAPVV